MRKRRFALAASMFAVSTLVLAACSDVQEPTDAGTGGTTAAAQCAGDTITIAVNPWVGAEANAAVAQAVMQNEMGCTVELQEINESGQFPAMADGDVDATL
jgi:glycine betaine/proline transport system substrate-binding protein